MSLDLTQLKALEANATDAPWASHIIIDKDDNEWPTFKLETLDGNALDYEHPERDAALIAYLRNNAPNLIARLEAADRMADALETIAGYDKDSQGGQGICPYGCDTPHVAQQALAAYRKEVAE